MPKLAYSGDFTALISKYDTALTLYDGLTKEIAEVREATHTLRQKTLKLLGTKARRKRAFSLQGEALDVLLAAGVKAQQKRKAAGARRLRRCRGTLDSPSRIGSPVKRRALGLVSEMVEDGKGVNVKRPVSAHAMTTRRSLKLDFVEDSG